MLTTQVASHSILSSQVLVVCLTLVWWPTTVTAKALTSRQKEKPHGKKQKTHGIKNNLAVRQKEKDSWQKEKPHGKKKKTRSKKKTSRQKQKDSRQNFFDSEKTFYLFLLPWGRGYSFCREVILFAVRLILLLWQWWTTVLLKFCSRRFLMFQHVGIHEN